MQSWENVTFRIKTKFIIWVTWSQTKEYLWTLRRLRPLWIGQLQEMWHMWDPLWDLSGTTGSSFKDSPRSHIQTLAKEGNKVWMDTKMWRKLPTIQESSHKCTSLEECRPRKRFCGVYWCMQLRTWRSSYVRWCSTRLPQ